MSASLPSPQAAPEASSADSAAVLAGLRAEIDRLDEALHDLLMQRAAVVEKVAAQGGKGRVALRPGREADIVRRLLARHRGHLPARAVARIWRELLAATTAMQGPYSVAVGEAGSGAEIALVAREHFGALTPLRAHGSAAQAMAEVAAGTATVAVLPLPAEGEPDPWWPALLRRDGPRLHVVARLPFWAPRGEGAPRAQALVLAAVPPDPSRRDRSLLGLEMAEEPGRARLAEAVAAAGFPGGRALLHRSPLGAPGVARVLLDVDGFVAAGNPRLAALDRALGPTVVLGAYAVPVEGEIA